MCRHDGTIACPDCTTIVTVMSRHDLAKSGGVAGTSFQAVSRPAGCYRSASLNQKDLPLQFGRFRAYIKFRLKESES